MNDSGILSTDLNITLDLIIKPCKNSPLSWVPCTEHKKQEFLDTRLGNELPNNRRLSLASNISSSSLKDLERGALEDELTAYMKELTSG